MRLLSLESYIEEFYLTKKSFADHMGFTQQRIQQMIKRDGVSVIVDGDKHFLVSVREEIPRKIK